VDGNFYTAYQFGTAGCWMTENLATTKNQKRCTTLTKNNSSSYDPYYTLPSTSNNSTTLTETQAQNSNYYGKNEGKPGFFYNWAAAVGAESGTAAQNTTSYPACNDCPSLPAGSVNVASQDICPTGWHLPSDWEWNNLEKEITNSYTQYSTASTAPTRWSDTWRTTSGSYRGGHGTLMRNPKNLSISTQSPAGLSNAKEKGFSGLLVGFASSGNWSNYGAASYCWSSSSYSGTNAWRRTLAYSYAGVFRITSPKDFLWSVRCKKDE
jgi:uncharacterized protein (TIGR02145 family)